MAKIPGTHKHATIASIPTSKEYKDGWERIFGKKHRDTPPCRRRMKVVDSVGVEFVCDYQSPPNQCSECVVNGGEIDPRTGKAT